MRGYPRFSFLISITLVKIYISRIIINRGKNTFELVGTVLNSYEYTAYNSVLLWKQWVPQSRARPYQNTADDGPYKSLQKYLSVFYNAPHIALHCEMEPIL